LPAVAKLSKAELDELVEQAVVDAYRHWAGVQ
jgi:hypothetical protein